MSNISVAMISALLLISHYSHGFVGAGARSALDCSTRNSQTKYHNALVHNVAIRGEDDRELVAGKSATMPLACKKKTGSGSMASGSINLVEGKRAVTVLHNLVDLNTCEPLARLDDCGLYDGELSYSIKWASDPVELCKSGYNQDMAVEASFVGKAPKRKGYKVICKSELGELKNSPVTLKGAMAKNFSSMTKSQYGKAVVEGKGIIYRVSPYENVVTYDADTGKGTSGGAAIIDKDGEEYLIGVHRGDRTSIANSNTENGEAQSIDGLPADENDNYGEAMIFPDNMNICGSK